MHEFYRRIQTVFQQAGSNRNQFCRKYKYNYQTLQAYWNSDKLPPGNVLEDLAQEFNVSLDALVFGRKPTDVRTENPIVERLTRFLEQQDDENLLRIEGALKMFKSLTLSGSLSPAGEDSTAEPQKLESLGHLLTRLAQHIQAGNMSLQDKEAAKELLNRIVLNVYEQDVEINDEWAQLEEVP